MFMVGRPVSIDMQRITVSAHGAEEIGIARERMVRANETKDTLASDFTH